MTYETENLALVFNNELEEMRDRYIKKYYDLVHENPVDRQKVDECDADLKRIEAEMRRRRK